MNIFTYDVWPASLEDTLTD